MNKEKIYNMTLFAVFASISIVLGLVPNLGYIQLIPAFGALTILHIPVLIGVMFLPLSYSLGLGFVFGLTSFIASYYQGTGAITLAFNNPLISVVPRVLFSLVAYYIYYGFKKIFSKSENGKYYSFIVITIITVLFLYFTSLGIYEITGWNLNIIYIVAGIFLIVLLIFYYYFLSQEKYQTVAYIPAVLIVASLIHSLMVLSLIGLIKPMAFGGEDTLGAILSLMSSYSLIEALLAVLIGSPIIVALFNLKENEVNDNDTNV